MTYIAAFRKALKNVRFKSSSRSWNLRAKRAWDTWVDGLTDAEVLKMGREANESFRSWILNGELKTENIETYARRNHT